jgi:protein-tyrosine phosphatase
VLQPFEFHEVSERLWVGPCPSSPERIQALKQARVTSLLSLQTDGDLQQLQMSWPLMWRYLMANGIAAHRLPIEDFDEHALAVALEGAAGQVRDLHVRGSHVYLHCTAGLNRSPTVAIAFLVRHAGMPLDAAWEQVCSRRNVVPNRKALERWLGVPR